MHPSPCSPNLRSDVFSLATSTEEACSKIAKRIFDDLDSMISNFEHPIVSQRGVDTEPTKSSERCGNPTMESCRNEQRNYDRLIYMKELHLDVLRRVMEMTKNNLDELANARMGCVCEANQQILHRSGGQPLPVLPFEIIQRIFSFLYLLDEGDEEDQTTLQRLLQDARTSEEWKETIRKEIPVLVLDYEEYVFSQYTANVVGPKPAMVRFGIEPLSISSPATPMSALIGGQDCRDPSSVSSLKSLLSSSSSKHPWRDLFIAPLDRNYLWSLPGMLEVCVDAGTLPNLLRLEICYSHISQTEENARTIAHRLASIAFTKAGSGSHWTIPSRLRFARLPVPLIKVLAPIISELTHLHLWLSEPDELEDFSQLVDCFRSLPQSITYFSISFTSSRRGPRRFVGLLDEHGSVRLMNLRRLTITDCSSALTKAIIGVLDCPKLESLLSESRSRDVEYFIPFSWLHSRYPTLKEIHASFCLAVDYKYSLYDLIHPDSDSNWLLPNLEVIRFDFLYGSTTKDLLDLVINRLHAENAASIRSVSIKGISTGHKTTWSCAFLASLHLFVSEVIHL